MLQRSTEELEGMRRGGLPGARCMSGSGGQVGLADPPGVSRVVCDAPLTVSRAGGKSGAEAQGGSVLEACRAGACRVNRDWGRVRSAPAGAGRERKRERGGEDRREGRANWLCGDRC